MTIKPATRQGIRPLVCFYSESGCGKTYSSLLLARGFVGPSGRIGMIDSERGRGSLYADVLPGGYDVLQLEDPFTPKRYIEAMDAIEAGGYSIGVIDSGSHEWDGPGGVLDMADANETKSGRPGLHNWRGPKLEHAMFVLRLMRSAIPWVICLRAKFKTKQRKDDKGKTVIIKDDFTTPIQADDFIFETTVHGEIMPDHSFRLTKCSHPALKSCFPDQAPIAIEHGQLLARWCSAPSAGQAPAGAVTSPTAPADNLKALKAKLWKLCEPIRGTDKTTWASSEAFMVANGILSEGKKISALTAEE